MVPYIGWLIVPKGAVFLTSFVSLCSWLEHSALIFAFTQKLSNGLEMLSDHKMTSE